MEIKYLTKLKETPKIGSWENEGLPEIKIKELENKLKIKFPLAFKEYLFLAGEFNDIFDSWNIEFEHLEYYQEEVQESMQNMNLHLKPFFAFATYGGENALFFFLDEGDNPPVYGYTEEKLYEDENGKELFYKKVRNSFSEEIELKIKNALNK